MTLKRIALTFYAIILLLFVFAIIITTFVELFGTCATTTAEILTCDLWGMDVTPLQNPTNVVGYLANTNFFIFWILLGGCSMYIFDWLKKRNA